MELVEVDYKLFTDLYRRDSQKRPTEPNRKQSTHRLSSDNVNQVYSCLPDRTTGMEYAERDGNQTTMLGRQVRKELREVISITSDVPRTIDAPRRFGRMSAHKHAWIA